MQLQPEEIRRLWIDAGGKFHGPNVETATIPEKGLFIFINDLIEKSAK